MAPVRANPTLSADLISEILKRLPVKSLVQYQLVSKTWLSMIKDPAFVKAQLCHALTTQTYETLIVTDFKRKRYDKYLLLKVDSRQIVADLKFPYPRGEFGCSRLMGSVNGIVCVASDNYETRTTSICFWNPAIRQSKLISSHAYVSDEDDQCFGFGYDPIDHDFKVVRLTYSYSDSCSAEVYSANKNVWRKVPDPIDYPWNHYFHVCVNGFLYGLGNIEGMLTFDLNKEVMLDYVIELPYISPGEDDYENICFIEFNNSVAVVMLVVELFETDIFDGKFKLWTLTDFACLRDGGVEASWTLMFSIDYTNVNPAYLIFGYFSNRDLLLLIKDVEYRFNRKYMWVSYNAYTKDVKIVPISLEMAGFYFHDETCKYTESLISLTGFKQVNCSAGKDDN